MRKTSQDGGDNMSITSGVENEIKKPIVGIMKTKRNSIKKKVQNFSHESDDGVIEPLLHKEKMETPNQSAKCLLPKTKTESCEKGNDRDKLLSDDRLEKPSLSAAPSVYGNPSIPNGTKETKKIYENSSTIHNHMNSNVFSNFDDAKKIITPRSQILVEINDNKRIGYNPSPLIFTTAKIHTDVKTKSMEPVQVTPVPILSTIEGSVKVGVGKNISGICEGNNMVNTVCTKPYETETKDIKNAQISTASSDFSPCMISSENNFKRNVVMDPDMISASSSILSNHSIKPVNTVDIKKIPNTDLNTATKNTLVSTNIPLNADAKDIKTKASVDVHKNNETNKIVASQGTSANSTKTKKSFEESIIEPKKENILSETSFIKTNDKDNSQSTPVSTATSIKNETISIKTLSPATSAIATSPCTTMTSISNMYSGSLAVSKAVATTSECTKNIITNITSAVKPTVSQALVTLVTTPLITSSSLVISTNPNATTKVLTSKPLAVKTIPVTTSSPKPMTSQSVLVNTVTKPSSGADIVLNKTVKPTEIPSSNTKSNVKTISANNDISKSLNKSKPTTVSTSSTSISTSIVPSVKRQESLKQTTKPTISGTKSSTSTIISKPAIVSSTPTSFSGKGSKPTSTKSSSSSVKTLITSNDKPSNSGSSKTITSTKSLNKQIDAKGTESNKKI
ncbi:mucin-2-like isoform X1 [Plodia interpunctella]|uniref:mucin-2-like isoform X1 n=1 Tax=Plodia interpunctella TaxID=58824 RepID=UPI00236824B9|nr:uncharacterized protein LOC128669415 isoform X1 [Plodia interpunctella]